MSKNKFMLIGWDAADWKIINPLLDQGLMPNLERMVNQGTIGNLATMNPSYSPMLWTSIATGKHAYKHGIHGFLQVSEDRESLRPVLSTSRKVKAIWEMLNIRNLKTHVVGWWPSHPAEPMNGISLSNFFQKASPGQNPNFVARGSVYPDHLHQRFAELKITSTELTGQHMLPFVPYADRIDQLKDNSLLKIANETAMAASIQAAFTNIIRNEEWDFSAVYFDAIDHYCHGFIKFHPPKQDHIPQHAFDLYNNVVTAGYRFHDMMLGRLLELVDDQTTIMLISDHGFESDHLRLSKLPDEPGAPAYEHSPYGIFAMMGPNIKKDHLIHGANLLDICPTILAHFNLPIGQDMDGDVLLDVFDEEKSIGVIDSWESIPNPILDKRSFDASFSKKEEEHLLNQLIELGYVEPIGNDLSETIRTNLNFNNLNLAKSYIFGGKLKEAAGVLEALCKENPEVPRYKFHLASCYQGLGRISDCKLLVDELNKSNYYNQVALDLMQATLLLDEGQFVKALDLLISVEKNLHNPQGEIYAKIAKCYMYLGHHDRAQLALDKGFAQDYEFYQLHLLQGILLYHKNKYDEAIVSLLNAAGLEYHDQTIHRYMGMSLYNIGKYEDAAAALEICLVMRPSNNHARNTLIDIYKIHLNKPQLAAKHRQEIRLQTLGEIIVVSGLPRSGTSMMMQMLDKSGLDIYTDKKRNADESNPKGYYEHESVKTLLRNKKWVKECSGKVVKVISNLLPALPLNYKYKVIMMTRDLDEVIHSQRRMLAGSDKVQAFGRTLEEEKKEWNQSLQLAFDWASRNQNVEVIKVDYSEVIEDPFAQAIRISEFLNHTINPEQMVSVVDPRLYRQKLVK